MSAAPDPLRVRRLLDAGRALVADLDPQAVLERTLTAAREVTGAGHAAVAILDIRREEIEQSLTLGTEQGVREAVGDQTLGHSVLGLLIEEPRPLRLGDVREHPRRCPVPEDHPPMRGFLGVPIMIRGLAWGALYLTEAPAGEFTEIDEEAGVILANWAAAAIEKAHQYEHSERRRLAREPAFRGPLATPGIAMAVGGGGGGLARVLDLILERARALLDARSLEATDADREEDEKLLTNFAASAATAVAMAQGVESDRLRSLIAAGDAERRRWARELHDETLQGLGALRLLLASARRRGDLEHTGEAVDEAIQHIEREIENLHSIISDLRPAALDELGLRPALEALLERRGDRDDLTITSQLVLPDPKAGEDRLASEIESTVYRVVQEALTNIVKHANARSVRVAVTASGGAVSIEVRDDGVGFSPDVRAAGFGLTGMRERVGLTGGTVRIESGDGGTLVRADLPPHTRRATDRPAFDRATS